MRLVILTVAVLSIKYRIPYLSFVSFVKCFDRISIKQVPVFTNVYFLHEADL